MKKYLAILLSILILSVAIVCCNPVSEEAHEAAQPTEEPHLTGSQVFRMPSEYHDPRPVYGGSFQLIMPEPFTLIEGGPLFYWKRDMGFPKVCKWNPLEPGTDLSPIYPQ